MPSRDDEQGTPSSGGLATFEASGAGSCFDAPGSQTGSFRLYSHSKLTLNPVLGVMCFGSFGVPDAINKSITLMIEKCTVRDARIPNALLEISETTADTYSNYLCAQFAHASLIVAVGDYENAGEPLLRLWKIGSQILWSGDIRTLRFSASQGNASFLTGSAMLAQYKVLKGDVSEATDIVDRVISWDVERATQAAFIKAHIAQLKGNKNALDLLVRVASVSEPMAFYALGLEHLRRRNGDESKDAFENAFKLAPTVAAILLRRNEFWRFPSSVSEGSATRYVETFCLPEWSADDLSLLDSLANRYVRRYSPPASSLSGAI